MAEAGAPAARCRLYLEAPDPLPANFADLLDVAFAGGDIACLRLRPSPEILPIVAKAQARGCAVLLTDSPGEVAGFGADGVHLNDPETYRRARGLLPSASIGVFCGNSRHVAMEAGDAGADYVSLDAEVELVTWWAEVMVVPVVVELGDGLDQAGEFIAAGAEFLCIGEGIWRSEASLRPALDRLKTLIG
jgi:thiamine-phosphate pyrophosphorylase